MEARGTTTGARFNGDGADEDDRKDDEEDLATYTHVGADHVMKDQLAELLGELDTDAWFDWADHAKGLDPQKVMQGRLDHLKQFEDAGAFEVLSTTRSA